MNGSHNGNPVQVVVRPPDEEQMGPAMRELTPQQRIYVCALVDGGSQMRQKDAAVLAGFAHPNQASNRLLQHQGVQEAIKEMALARLRSSALVGADVLISLAQDIRAPHSVQLKAAERLLDQAGLIVATKHEVSVERKLSREEKLEKAVRICQILGLDPREKLGMIGVAVDAEFREVPKEVEPDPLADILG